MTTTVTISRTDLDWIVEIATTANLSLDALIRLSNIANTEDNR